MDVFMLETKNELKEIRKDNEKIIKLLRIDEVDENFLAVSIFRIFNLLILSFTS